MPEMPLGGMPVETEPALNLPPQGRHGLVGREAELVRLERAFQRSPIVLLTGPAGVGKTELACEFARRLVDKGEGQDLALKTNDPPVPPPGKGELRGVGVFFTAFEYGAGLCRVLHEMGTTLQGIGFAHLSLEQQRQWIIDYLKHYPCLLVWDNFENVFHDSSGRSLDDTESQELLDLLRDAGDGPSYILITGRGKDWADESGIGYVHEELGGLEPFDAQHLARVIVDEAGVDAQGLGHEYEELLKLLQGNPMSMQVVLPHLKQHPPSELAEALQLSSPQPSVTPLPLGEGMGVRVDVSLLDAALACSFSRLSPRTKVHLPFLALFQQRVLLDVLTFMTQGEVYKSVMGEEVGWGACRTFLREARDCGILDSISPSVYLISPTVTRFLRQQLSRRLSPAQIATLEQEFVRVYADLGDYFLESLSSENSESTVTGVLAEEANLFQALQLGIEHRGAPEAYAHSGPHDATPGRWERIQLIFQPLAQVYKMQERVLELRRLRERLLAHLGYEAAQVESEGAVELWMYLQGSEINDAMGRMELDRAESICHRVLSYLEPLGETTHRPRVASVCHHLGLIAQGRGQHQQAEDWYKAALEINEPLGYEAECADSYHQLGLIAQSGQRYDEAAEWHRRALEIRERLGDEAEMASESHQMALVAEAGSQFQEALEWYQKARLAYEHVGDKAGAAAVYHKIGLIAHVQYDYKEAAGWYQKALMAYEELGDEVSGASDYYQLGAMALHRYDYQEAEEWFRQALRAYQHLANEAAIASSCQQLGVAAHAQGRYQEAEERYHEALEIFVRLEDEVTAASTWGQLGLLADQMGNYCHAVWYVGHTYEIAVAHQLPLLRQVRTHLSSLQSKMGTESFLRCWQEVSDTDILSELAE